MCNPVAAVMAGSAILGAGASVYSAKKGAKAQKKAQAANEASAARESNRAEQAYNKANQRMPDIASIMAGNRAAAGQGMGATFLTGAGGVKPGGMQLGGSSLLGG